MSERMSFKGRLMASVSHLPLGVTPANENTKVIMSPEIIAEMFR